MLALESQREDRLFDDPYAQEFVDAAPGAFPEERAVSERPAAHGPLASLGAAFSAHAVIRTRFYDDFLTAATAAGSRQVVLLAAGPDTMTATARQIPAMRKYTSLWKGGLGDPPGWLADHGWRPEFHGLAALSRSYRRPVPDSARNGFLTAVRVATVARGSSRPEPG